MLDYPSSDQLKNCSSTRLGVRYSLGHFVCKETAAVATFTAPIDCTSKLFPPKIDFQKHLIKKVEIFQKSAREGNKICKITAATKTKKDFCKKCFNKGCLGCLYGNYSNTVNLTTQQG